jgi:transcriptional regulator with XRE-family HTH domain
MEIGIPDFGPYLRSARERKGLSLRAVEEATGISNPYLSQLESGKVRQPSPVVLHKLALLFEVSYKDLLRLAGYPVPDEPPTSSKLSSAALRFQNVTPEEADALDEYLAFLRSKRPRRKK